MRDLLTEMEALCRRHKLPVERAKRATQILQNNAQQSGNVTLPECAPETWSQRNDLDRKLNPLEFYEKYWRQYSSILTQCDLRRLDSSLFEAIKSHCRSRHLNPRDYLPLPATTRSKAKYEKSRAFTESLDCG
jgi:hypothetical protein